MLAAIGFLPQPPAMIAPLGGGRPPELGGARQAVDELADWLGRQATSWVVLGADRLPTDAGEQDDSGGRPWPHTRRYGSATIGSFHRYGREGDVALGPDPAPSVVADLPLPLLVAGWLRGEHAPTHHAPAVVADAAASQEQCRSIGQRLAAELAGSREPQALLVLGEGAAAAGDSTGAAAFDRVMAEVLGEPDVAALAGLDDSVARRFGATGRVPWQVAAYCALQAEDSGRGAEPAGSDHGWKAELTFNGRPADAGYLVARWWRR